MLLMLLRLLNILFCLLSICKSCVCVVVNLDEVITLVVHLRIDLFRNVVDVSHELLHVVQLLLALLNNVLHVRCFSLDFQFFLVKLHERLTTFILVQACLAIVVGKRLPPLDKIEVLLHLDVNLLRLLLVFVDDLGQATIVGLLLLLLLPLRAIGHTDLTIVINLLLQVFGLLIHLFCLLIDALSKVVIVHVRSNLVFLRASEKSINQSVKIKA